MKLSSSLLLWTVASLNAYLLLSLSYALVNDAFGVPLGTAFRKEWRCHILDVELVYDGSWLGFPSISLLSLRCNAWYSNVGLPMESLFTLIGLKWVGYFLSFCRSTPLTCCCTHSFLGCPQSRFRSDTASCPQGSPSMPPQLSPPSTSCLTSSNIGMDSPFIR